mmetsp:Transcript_8104/g.17594  ORF Transcript_8104/g.17594 Transcript_8104/m.17594 type:complete len:238 (+) Transcript_8104:295-1008(+)
MLLRCRPRESRGFRRGGPGAPTPRTPRLNRCRWPRIFETGRLLLCGCPVAGIVQTKAVGSSAIVTTPGCGRRLRCAGSPMAAQPGSPSREDGMGASAWTVFQGFSAPLLTPLFHSRSTMQGRVSLCFVAAVDSIARSSTAVFLASWRTRAKRLLSLLMVWELAYRAWSRLGQSAAAVARGLGARSILFKNALLQLMARGASSSSTEKASSLACVTSKIRHQQSVLRVGRVIFTISMS